MSEIIEKYEKDESFGHIVQDNCSLTSLAVRIKYLSSADSSFFK